MMQAAAVHGRKQGGLIRAVIARVIALALILAVFIPTISNGEFDGVSANATPHAIASVRNDSQAPVHGSCCCIESLQHCWYRTAEADGAPPLVRRSEGRAAYLFVDEAARSLSPDPLRKPPRSQA